MTIASLELDNLTLFDLNEEESAAVNGGVAVAVGLALATTTRTAQEGLADPNSTSRDILQRQLNDIGYGALGGALSYLIPVILGASAPVSVTIASLGKSEK